MTQPENIMIATMVTEYEDDYEILLETDRTLNVDKSRFYAWIINESDVLDRDKQISLDEWLDEWNELEEVMTEYLQKMQKTESIIWTVS